eukprot:12038513-Karenia_brevis.AAC.1
MASEVTNVQASVAAEASSRQIGDPQWCRPPDDGILQLNSHSDLPIDAVRSACGEWLSSLYSSEQWRLTGSGKQWTLHFVALSRTAAAMA